MLFSQMTLIFGYGSLVWKCDFPYISKRPATLEGYVRRFWQTSTDHRGTIETPGRVVTLIPMEEWKQKYYHIDPHKKEDGIINGYVFEIQKDDVEKVFKYLNYREKNGYELRKVNVILKDTNETVESFLYIAHSDNDDFLQEKDDFELESLANVISTVKGPSGFNHEYLTEMVRTLKSEFGFVDRHLHDLNAIVSDKIKNS